MLNEIVQQVHSLDPYELNSQTRPSKAFILLLKLFSLKLTKKQLLRILEPKQKSVFIRAIAILYVRFCILPQEQMSFYEPYLKDEEKIKISTTDKDKITIAEFIGKVIQDQKCLGILFPRIPTNYAKDFENKLKEVNPTLLQNNSTQRKTNRGKYDDDDMTFRRRKTTSSVPHKRDRSPEQGDHRGHSKEPHNEEEPTYKKQRREDTLQQQSTDGSTIQNATYADPREERELSPVESRFGAKPSATTSTTSTTSSSIQSKYMGSSYSNYQVKDSEAKEKILLGKRSWK